MTKYTFIKFWKEEKAYFASRTCSRFSMSARLGPELFFTCLRSRCSTFCSSFPSIRTRLGCCPSATVSSMAEMCARRTGQIASTAMICSLTFAGAATNFIARSNMSFFVNRGVSQGKPSSSQRQEGSVINRNRYGCYDISR